MSYSNGLRGEVTLVDHEVSSVVQFDYGPRIGLNFSFKGLMFLQLALWEKKTTKKKCDIKQTSLEIIYLPGSA